MSIPRSTAEPTGARRDWSLVAIVPSAVALQMERSTFADLSCGLVSQCTPSTTARNSRVPEQPKMLTLLLEN